MQTVNVPLDDRSYDILIGPGLLQAAGAHIRTVSHHDRLVVIADATVAKIHGQELMASLTDAEITDDLLEIPSGESSKGFQTFSN
jgi:3-dehydroquinate synthase